MSESIQDYKHSKEEFVSGHSGSSLWEISLLSLGIPLCVLLRETSCLGCIFNKRLSWLCGCLDFVVLILPPFLSMTVLSEYKVIVGIILLSLTAIQLLYYRIIDKVKNLRTYLQQDYGSRLEFVSYFRSYIFICTSIGILAVDFVVFPRRYCKAETYGTGLMDTGVGLFIVANGIVSPESRNKNKVNNLKSVIHSSISSIPLIILGVIRIVTTKGIEYQEHVTEYGVHWNFFFTLAIVKVFSSILLWMLGNINLIGPGLLMLVLYQICLVKTGLSSYLEHGLDGRGGRHGLLDSNREGIFSCVGYIALYFFAIELGKHLFQSNRKTVQDWVKFTMQLFMLEALLWFILLWSVSHVQQVSRRFSNLPFVLWMIAQSVLLLMLLLAVDIVCGFFNSGKSEKAKDEEVCLLEAVNYNGLFYFLFANLLTGLVNVSINTLSVSPFNSILIIFVYLFTLNIIIYTMYIWKIRLKFW